MELGKDVGILRDEDSVGMPEAGIHRCRGEPGSTQNLRNTKGNNNFYFTVGQRDINEAPVVSTSSLNCQN